MSAGRVWAIVIVALLHAVLGYAFVTGLAMSVIRETMEDLKTFDVEEPPPPEEEPPPPPPDQPSTPPPVSAPPVQMRMQTNNPIQAERPVENPNPNPLPAQRQEPVRQDPPTRTCPDGTVVAANAACPEPPRRQAARPPVHRSGTISNDDYPSAAIRAEAQGTTVISMTIGADGRVTGCTVSRSSGNGALDSTACSLAQRRFRFTPAQDENGNNVAGRASRSIRWQLPEE